MPRRVQAGKSDGEKSRARSTEAGPHGGRTRNRPEKYKVKKQAAHAAQTEIFAPRYGFIVGSLVLFHRAEAVPASFLHRRHSTGTAFLHWVVRNRKGFSGRVR